MIAPPAREIAVLNQNLFFTSVRETTAVHVHVSNHYPENVFVLAVADTT